MNKILTIAFLLFLGYGVYILATEYKITNRIWCLALAKTPVSTVDLGKKNAKPEIICAEPTTDAGKDCYDSVDCVKACILDKSSDGYENALDFYAKYSPNIRGHCQEYEEMDCFVERDHGSIVIHKCQ